MILRSLTLKLDEPEAELPALAARRLRIPEDAIVRYAVVRRSLDARKGRDPLFVYAMELSLNGGLPEEQRIVRRARGRNVAMLEDAPPQVWQRGERPLERRPVVVGFGPAGMFAALRLAECGYAPIVLERGRDVRRRHKDIMQTFYRERKFNAESNLLYGEGGAGTYSDGKVYTRVGTPAVQEVLAILVRFGAHPDVLIDARPHIGSDRLPTICRRLRGYIEKLGGEVRFEQRVDDFEIDDGQIAALRVNEAQMKVGPVLLGIGHSARDTLTALHAAGVKLEPRPFQFGVRIEHPQAMVNQWQYGSAAEHPRLPPADYTLVAPDAGNGCDMYSFCMCPGGMILPTNEAEGLVATNGASRASRSGKFANSGFVISILPDELDNDPLAGLAFQRKWERLAFEAAGRDYAAPMQRCSDFLKERVSDGALETSYPLGGKWSGLRAMLPPRVIHALAKGLPMLERKLPGFAGEDGLIAAPESRASAPVRIVRHKETRESVNVTGLFPIGEGAGYAGGIVSAAIDGIRTADALIAQYKPAKGQ